MGTIPCGNSKKLEHEVCKPRCRAVCTDCSRERAQLKLQMNQLTLLHPVIPSAKFCVCFLKLHCATTLYYFQKAGRTLGQLALTPPTTSMSNWSVSPENGTALPSNRISEMQPSKPAEKTSSFTAGSNDVQNCVGNVACGFRFCVAGAFCERWVLCEKDVGDELRSKQ